MFKYKYKFYKVSHYLETFHLFNNTFLGVILFFFTVVHYILIYQTIKDYESDF